MKSGVYPRPWRHALFFSFFVSYPPFLFPIDGGILFRRRHNLGAGYPNHPGFEDENIKTKKMGIEKLEGTRKRRMWEKAEIWLPVRGFHFRFVRVPLKTLFFPFPVSRPPNILHRIFIKIGSSCARPLVIKFRTTTLQVSLFAFFGHRWTW